MPTKLRARQIRERDWANLYLDEEGLVLPLQGKAYRPRTRKGRPTGPERCQDCCYLRACRSLARQNLPVHCEDTAIKVVSGANKKTIILTV